MARTINIVVAVVLVAVIAVAVTMLPSGFNADVSQVGQGRPAVVLVHDIELVQSLELMGMLDSVRGEFEPEMLFLVADPNHPDGAGFAAHHGLSRATLAVFDADGALIARHDGPATPATVREVIARGQQRTGY